MCGSLTGVQGRMGRARPRLQLLQAGKPFIVYLRQPMMDAKVEIEMSLHQMCTATSKAPVNVP